MKELIQDTKQMRGPNMDSDYCLQEVIIKQKLLTIYRKTVLQNKKQNKTNLQNPIKLRQCRIKLYNRLRNIAEQ